MSMGSMSRVNSLSCNQKVAKSASILAKSVLATGMFSVVGGLVIAAGSAALGAKHDSYDNSESFIYGLVGGAILLPVTYTAVKIRSWIISSYYRYPEDNLEENSEYNAQDNQTDISFGDVVDQRAPNCCFKALIYSIGALDTVVLGTFPLWLPILAGITGYEVMNKSDSIMNSNTVALASTVGAAMIAVPLAGCFYCCSFFYSTGTGY